MKKFLRVLAILMALTLSIISFAACNNGQNGSDTEQNTESDSVTSASNTTDDGKDPVTPPDDNDPDDNKDPDDGEEEEDPYKLTAEVPADGLIKTAAELQAVLSKGASNGNYTVQAESLDMSKLKYNGLGTDTDNFTGSFDFGNCVVSGLTSPLFNYTKDAEIKNLVVADTDISYTKAGVTAYGLIVSVMNGGSLSNITLNDSVKLDINLYSTNARVGGIVAKAENGEKALIIDNCVSYATLITDSDKMWMGGIVGSFNGENGVLSNCINYGSVTDNAVGYDSKIGGVVGSAKKVTIRSCANYGDVTSREEKGQAAGICAYFEASGFVLEYCINAGNINGGQYTGGMVGYTNRDAGTVQYCVNIGDVGNSAKADDFKSGAIYGFAKNKEVIKDSFYLASNNTTAANVDGNASKTNLVSCTDLNDLSARLAQSGEVNGKFKVENSTVVFSEETGITPDPTPSEDDLANGIIRTAEGLQSVLTSGKTDGTYKVEAETLDLTGLTYTGLGTSSAPFTGTFDFGGCVVKGLSGPLFGYTRNAVIQNLVIAETDITYSHASETAYGLVIVSMKGGSVENVTLQDTVSLTVDLSANNSRFGGIIGILEVGDSDILVNNCVSYATLNAPAAIGEKFWIGGIVGYINSGAANATITNCVNYGTITNNRTNNKDSKVAGVVSAIKASDAANLIFRNNANYGSIISKEEGGQAAGICAYIESDNVVIEFCINGGKVDGGKYTGGIVGYTNKAGIVVRYCVNTAEVKNSAGDDFYSGSIYGLAKKSEKVENCFCLASNNAVNVGVSGTDVTVTNVLSGTDLTDLMSKLEAVEAMNGKFAVQNDTVVFVAV